MNQKRLESIKQLALTFNHAGPLAQAVDELVAEVERLQRENSELMAQYRAVVSRLEGILERFDNE